MEISKIEAVINNNIYVIRGRKVILTQDLANLYNTEVKIIIQSVKRNIDRFPEDFVFQLTDDEFTNLKSQIVTSSWGGLRRSNPYAFTEHGVAMLSSVLRSKIAIQMNIFIVRAFIKMRESYDRYTELSQKMSKMELKQKEDSDMLYQVHRVVRHMIEKPDKLKEKIGFVIKK